MKTIIVKDYIINHPFKDAVCCKCSKNHTDVNAIETEQTERPFKFERVFVCKACFDAAGETQ